MNSLVHIAFEKENDLTPYSCLCGIKSYLAIMELWVTPGAPWNFYITCVACQMLHFQKQAEESKCQK